MEQGPSKLSITGKLTAQLPDIWEDFYKLQRMLLDCLAVVGSLEVFL